MHKKLTTQEFINKAINKHGEKFVYSNVDYQRNDIKIEIICREHGSFFQRPNDHLTGYGCPYCAGTKKLTTEEFISRATKIHNNKYDYSKVVYKNYITKVEIICKEHGSFFQAPDSHTNSKQGCPKCGGVAKSNTTEFIEKSNKIHNNKYDYSKVNYTHAKAKIEIICKIHGSFFQTPNQHLCGSNCPDCSSSLPLALETFVERSNQTHDCKYDYSQVNYKNVYTKVEIICNKHGPFFQDPKTHMKGGICPRCRGRISRKELLWLTNMKISNTPNHRQKCFILDDRKIFVDGFDPDTNIVYEFLGDFWHGNPKTFNHLDYNPKTKTTFCDLYNHTIEKFKLLHKHGFVIYYIWENDFNSNKSAFKKFDSLQIL